MKGNPDMTDSEGQTVPPAAMNYAQYARALRDSIDYNLQGEYPDAIVADSTYDDNASRFRQNLKKQVLHLARKSWWRNYARTSRLCSRAF